MTPLSRAGHPAIESQHEVRPTVNAPQRTSDAPTSTASAWGGAMRLHSRFLSGSALFFLSASVVNLGNYAFNLILGRWLGPALFAEVNLVITLLLIMSLVAATLQMSVARFTAGLSTGSDLGAIAANRAWFARAAQVLGLLAAVGLVAGSTWLQEFFHTQSPWPFILLGLGVPVYLVQGIERGVLQGRMMFGRLALSYQAEMWSRLLLSALLVAAGLGVGGVVAAVTLSFVAAWLVARRAGSGLPPPSALSREHSRAARSFAGPVALALLGQILINNSDVLIVKHFYQPTDAGHYAALALIGRMVFFATWSVMTVLVPLAARAQADRQDHWHLMWLSLGIVGAVSAGVIGMSSVFGTQLVTALFGPAYLAIVPLLWPYALATGLFALANVIVTYRLSIGVVQAGLFGAAGGIVQVALLWLFHATLYQVIQVQIVLMALLLAALLVWEFRLRRRDTQRATAAEVSSDLGLKPVANV
jgi:O-antigen/teichoic acid export membrane protein